MKFIILNGSPKSEKSVTLQSIKYLEMHNKNHEFEYVHITREIKKYQKDVNEMIKLCEKISNSDGVIWSFPVYCAFIPSNYKKFIELIFEYGLEKYFEGRYTTAFSTSIHFYDHTAQNYIHGICDDLNMNYIKYLSHDMNDLLKKNQREELQGFLDIFAYSITNNIKISKEYKQLSKHLFKYTPGIDGYKVKTKKRTIIITDVKENDTNINRMINKYKSCIQGSVEVLNLNDIDIKGHCIGCCRCGYDNTCIYKDGFRSFLDYIIEKADIIIYASTIKDRYLSSLFQLYTERSFTYNHIPVLKGKQFAYIISGSLSEEKNLKQILEGGSMDGNLVGFVSDESGDSEILDKELESLAKLSIKYSEENYVPNPNFLGVGGQSIFNEGVSKGLSAIFVADYKYYKENGYLYRTSLKDVLLMVKLTIFRFLMGIKGFRKKVHENMYDNMLLEHVKILKNGEK